MSLERINMNETTSNTRLIYVSANCIDSELLDKEIDAILSVAREHNKKNNITGALLFNSGDFAQVLEGPEEAVEMLFERIQEDERHEGCVVLSCEEISKYSFSEWSMAYEGGDSEAKTHFSHMIKHSKSTGEVLSANEVFSVLFEHINQ